MTDTAPTSDTPPARNSILGRIKSRREEIAAAQFTDIRVPRWENPELWVRYGTLEHPFIERTFDRARKAKKENRGEAVVNSNADILIEACIGVYAIHPTTNEKVSLSPRGEDDEWTRFDPDLGETMGLSTDATARQVLRTVYFTDGDILSAAGDVVRFSGYVQTDADRDLLGE